MTPEQYRALLESGTSFSTFMPNPEYVPGFNSAGTTQTMDGVKMLDPNNPLAGFVTAIPGGGYRVHIPRDTQTGRGGADATTYDASGNVVRREFLTSGDWQDSLRKAVMTLGGAALGANAIGALTGQGPLASFLGGGTGTSALEAAGITLADLAPGGTLAPAGATAGAATAAGAAGAASALPSWLTDPRVLAAGAGLVAGAAAGGGESNPMPAMPDMSGFMNEYQRMGEIYGDFARQQAELGSKFMGEMDRQLGRGDQMFDIQNDLMGTAREQLALQSRSLGLQDDALGVMRDQLANQGRMFGVMDDQLGLQGQQLGYQQDAFGLRDQMLGQMNEQMALGRERFAALNPLSMQLTQGAADAQAQSLNQARDQYDFWTNTYRPVEQRMVDDAMRFNTEAERQRMAQAAGADVEQALATQRSAGMRALERMGVNPNSGRMMQLMAGDGLQAAKLRADAENNARVAAEEKGFGRLAQAAATGVRLPGQAVAALQASAQAANAGANTLGAADKIANLYTDNAVRIGGLGAQFGSQGVALGNTAAQFGGNAISAGNSAANFGNVAQGFGNLALGFGREGQGYADSARNFYGTARDFGALGDSITRTGLTAGQLGLEASRNQLTGLRNQQGTIDQRSGLTADIYDTQMGAYRDNERRRADRARGVGQVVGSVGSLLFRDSRGLARGGMVQGPGTGTSDDVEAMNGDTGQPIRLSNGEYVLPKKTVKAIGIDKLDQVVEKTNGHPPVHKQYDRRGQPKPRRKALSR